MAITSCNIESKQNQEITETTATKDTIPFAEFSNLKNQYIGFHSPNAINKIVAIENDYFIDYEYSESKYYGTEWRKMAQIDFYNDSTSLFEDYESNTKQKTDSMHCTIYAMKAIKEGLGSHFLKFETLHQSIWQEREYAGWSVAHILTKHFDWKAYLFISQDSQEYEACIKNFKKDKKYHVWRQPNILLEKIYDFDTEKLAIDSLLAQNEFGWGFSYQGWHTWITRFHELKECNWLGSPSSEYELTPLFISTKMTEYYNYNSHIVVFPPKKDIYE